MSQMDVNPLYFSVRMLHRYNYFLNGQSVIINFILFSELEQNVNEMVSTSPGDHLVYGCIKNLDDVLGSVETRGNSYYVKPQVELDFGDYVPGLEKLLQSCNGVNQRIYESMEFTDFEIETSDKSILPCHRMFLSGKI